MRTAHCGQWYNKWTTAADATFSADSKRGAATVSNIVNGASGRTTNVIEFSPPDKPWLRATRKAVPPPPLESLKVVLSARAASPTRVELIFRRVRARLNLALFGGRLKFGLTLLIARPRSFLDAAALPLPPVEAASPRVFRRAVPG